MKPLLILALLAFASCQSPSQQEGITPETTATLYWTGEIAADGCGFEIEMGGKRYLPENEDAIPQKYKQAQSSRVKLRYEPLPDPIDRRCGMLPQPRVMPAVRVLEVEEL